MIRLFNALAGRAERFSIHARILNMTLFVTTFFTALLAVQSVLEGLDPNLTFIVASLSVVFASLYFFARVRRKNKIVTPVFIAIGLVSISFMYFLSDGIDGDVPPYFVFSSIISVSLVKRKFYPYIIAVNALAFVACYMIEINFPEVISSYANETLRDRQVLYAITALTVFAGSAFALFKNNYDAERRIVKKQNLDLQRAQRSLIKAKEEAEKANMAKAEFLSTMSHEIRTPLNAVIGMSYILQEENPRPDQEENIGILKFSAENLLSLVNDVLDYSKIEAGKVVFEEAEFHLDELLNSLEQAHRLKAEEKGVELILHRSELVPATLIGDATRVTQILNNLLSNALKFTEKGKVELNINLMDRQGSDARVIFNIQDTGIGIPKDRQDEVFKSFTQADSATTRKYGGTGLGLAITKQLTDLMGGSISLQSTVGKGSTFRVELPFGVGRVKMDYKPKETNVPQPLLGRRILLAEDNPVNVVIAEKILTKWGAQLTFAKDGEEAIEKWREDQPELILMDLRMPKMTGIEATRVIRSEEEHKTPIIALTASAMLDEQNEIFQVGMDEYVSKPFNPAELLSKISKHLN